MLEELCLIWMLVFFLYCVVKFIKTREKPTRIEWYQKKYNLQRKWDYHSYYKHRIRALYYKILLWLHKRKEYK